MVKIFKKPKVKMLVISGKAENGKDFCATILKEKLEGLGKKVAIVHYADYLKFVARQYFDWDGIKNDHGRELLQFLGTDKARKNYPNIWVDVVTMLIKAIFIDFDYVIVADCRFPNEVKRPKKNGLAVRSIRVERLEYTTTLTEQQQKHPSETSLDNFKFDFYIRSKTGRENMEREIEKIIKHL